MRRLEHADSHTAGPHEWTPKTIAGLAKISRAVQSGRIQCARCGHRKATSVSTVLGGEEGLRTLCASCADSEAIDNDVARQHREMAEQRRRR